MKFHFIIIGIGAGCGKVIGEEGIEEISRVNSKLLIGQIDKLGIKRR